jgi:alpha-1,2-glucosyltransferase
VAEARARIDLPELLSALYALGFGFFLYADNGLRVDEQIHFDQIQRMTQGPGPLNEGLTTLPGFHAIVAGASWLAGGPSEFVSRATVFVLSLATVFAFYALVRAVRPQDAGTRLLQFTFIPFLFPQFFLIYTDVPAMLFVLLMLVAVARGRYRAAGFLGLVSCLIRQNDIVWVVFALAWSYLRDNGWTWIGARQSLDRYWTFVVTGMAFLLFVILNGGQVALGDAKAHPLGSFHLANVFFLLFLAAFAFLPLWLAFHEQWRARLRQPWTWAALVALFAVYWLGFVNTHPYNLDGYDYYLRNALLAKLTETPQARLLTFIPVACAALGLSSVPLHRAWWLIYPFTVLVLLPEWLVEQRYYLIPFGRSLDRAGADGPLRGRQRRAVPGRRTQLVLDVK